MQVVHVPCGAFVNDSEARAYREVNRFLLNVAADGTAFILTNVTHATPNRQADEIDMVVIGPSGAIVIEVKHWDATALRRNPDLVDSHAELIIAKAKRVAGRLRQVDPSLGFVPGTMLFTRESATLRRNGKAAERLGVLIYSLKDLDALLGLAIREGSAPGQRLAHALAPRQAASAGMDLRRIARFDELKLLSPPDDRFARVHSGRDPASGERVIIHSYDLSAAPSLEPAELTLRRAKREFDVVQRFQKSQYLPSLVDSWQPLPNYAGEVFFFTLADSAAVSVEQLKQDTSWRVDNRLAFASKALRALADLQTPVTPDADPLIHRGLDSETVRVRADGSPLFAGWRWARLPMSQTVAPRSLAALGRHAAPELREGGIESALPSSDVYSLCAVLAELFQDAEPHAVAARNTLELGLDDATDMRAAPADIAEQLELIAPPPAILGPSAVSASRWDEGHILEWNGERYRVVALLGQGGAGRTFKLEQLNGKSDDPIGTFVGKVVFNRELGETSLNAYKKVRSFARHDGLSDVLQTSANWSPHELMALLRWNRGEPLDAWRGEAQFLADHAGERSVEALLLRWFDELCAALDVLHVQGWAHGDVSPSNILVDDDHVLLIDYDLASPIGHVTATPGTFPYCSPGRRLHAPVQASDDAYALAASIFYVVTGRMPFALGNAHGDNGNLGWTSEEREQLPLLSQILDTAVDPDPARRFETASAARRKLRAETVRANTSSVVSTAPFVEVVAAEPLRPNVVNRVKDILSAYPGSRFGNAETRGLDTRFASDTYVDTALDASIPAAVRSGEISLVILCGNAGDGKTAFLQHLAIELGAASLPSSQRVWEGELHGRRVMINLDGAASWNGRSADDLLDKLFAPFHEGPPDDARVHFVAVNDGRLMEWIEGYERRHNGDATVLTHDLTETLGESGTALPPHIQLIELNQRSLVGGLDIARHSITTEFIDNLISKLVGADEAPSIWGPCKTCTAQTRCPMGSSADMMGASRDIAVLRRGKLFRERLTAALQAVHQRNEVHITARELKAAISYILFGLYACEDLHDKPDRTLHVPADHVFDPLSEQRQGELLRELARLDPGLEAHARVDRYLSGRGAPAIAHGAPRYLDSQGRPIPLRHARRIAYFEWTQEQIEGVSGERGALDLKDGRHYARFRNFPLLPEIDREIIKRDLCLGLSRLETLPEVAFSASGVVPIRIVPRTPTETAFWVEKPLDRFELKAERFDTPDGLETLHRYLTLCYRPAIGPTENLTVSLELYALLIDLANGVQILDAFSDDVFANLNVFTQRLAQEDERSLRAWNPADEQRMFAIGIEMGAVGQTITLSSEKL